MKLYKVVTRQGDKSFELLFANETKASAAFDVEVNTLQNIEFWFSVTLEVYEESFEGFFVKTHTLRHYEP